MALFDAGPLIGPVALSVAGGPASVEVNAGLSRLRLASAVPAELPDGAVWDSSIGATLHGSGGFGAQLPAVSLAAAGPGGVFTVYVRCYGRAPVTLTLFPLDQPEPVP